MNKKLLTDEEKLKDDRFPSVSKVFPEFDCYSDGTYEYNRNKVPPGFQYIMDVNKGKCKTIRENQDGVIHREFPEKG